MVDCYLHRRLICYQVLWKFRFTQCRGKIWNRSSVPMNKRLRKPYHISLRRAYTCHVPVLSINYQDSQWTSFQTNRVSSLHPTEKWRGQSFHLSCINPYWWLLIIFSFFFHGAQNGGRMGNRGGWGQGERGAMLKKEEKQVAGSCAPGNRLCHVGSPEGPPWESACRAAELTFYWAKKKDGSLLRPPFFLLFALLSFSLNLTERNLLFITKPKTNLHLSLFPCFNFLSLLSSSAVVPFSFVFHSIISLGQSSKHLWETNGGGGLYYSFRVPVWGAIIYHFGGGATGDWN